MKCQQTPRYYKIPLEPGADFYKVVRMLSDSKTFSRISKRHFINNENLSVYEFVTIARGPLLDQALLRKTLEGGNL